jgi:hypothetical protein
MIVNGTQGDLNENIGLNQSVWRARKDALLSIGDIQKRRGETPDKGASSIDLHVEPGYSTRE